MREALALPMLDRMYKEYQPGDAPPAMEELAGKIRGADAFVFVTGEYNWGMQPGLKNLTDHYLEEWFWRPAAIASYSAGRLSGARVNYVWHATLSEMGMVVISSTLTIGPIGQTLDHHCRADRRSRQMARARLRAFCRGSRMVGRGRKGHARAQGAALLKPRDCSTGPSRPELPAGRQRDTYAGIRGCRRVCFPQLVQKDGVLREAVCCAARRSKIDAIEEKKPRPPLTPIERVAVNREGVASADDRDFLFSPVRDDPVHRHRLCLAAGGWGAWNGLRSAFEHPPADARNAARPGFGGSACSRDLHDRGIRRQPRYSPER